MSVWGGGGPPQDQIGIRGWIYKSSAVEFAVLFSQRTAFGSSGCAFALCSCLLVEGRQLVRNRHLYDCEHYKPPGTVGERAVNSVRRMRGWPPNVLGRRGARRTRGVTQCHAVTVALICQTPFGPPPPEKKKNYTRRTLVDMCHESSMGN
jgi:hypothetical protein